MCIRDRGTHSFNAGSSQQLPDGSYYMLKEAAAQNDLKTVYLEMFYTCLLYPSPSAMTAASRATCSPRPLPRCWPPTVSRSASITVSYTHLQTYLLPTLASNEITAGVSQNMMVYTPIAQGIKMCIRDRTEAPDAAGETTPAPETQTEEKEANGDDSNL